MNSMATGKSPPLMMSDTQAPATSFAAKPISTGRAPNAVRLAVAGNIPRQQLDAGLAALAYLLPRPPHDMAV